MDPIEYFGLIDGKDVCTGYAFIMGNLALLKAFPCKSVKAVWRLFHFWLYASVFSLVYLIIISIIVGGIVGVTTYLAVAILFKMPEINEVKYMIKRK